MRTKNVLKNVFIEIFLYVLIGIIGFFKIKFFIKYIGSEMNGYFQVINNITTYVFLAEAGLTSGVIYKLYKPLATHDYEAAKALFLGAKRIFIKIGFVVSALSIVSIAVFPFIVDAKGTDLLIVMLSFVLVVGSNLLSFFICSQAYNALFFADQKKYLSVTISNVVKIVFEIFGILAIMYFKNLITIAIFMFASKVVEEFFIYIYGRRKYTWLKDFSKCDTSAEGMSKDIILHQVATVASNNIDQIILLISKTATVVSIYASYNYIHTFISTVISKISNNISHSFGNMFATEDSDKSFYVFKEYMSFCFFLGLIVSIPFAIFSRSFVLLWLKEEPYVVSYFVACLFAFNLFSASVLSPLIMSVNTNGLFKQTKYYVLGNALVNLVISILLVSKFGIAGVLFGTCFTYFYNIFWRSIITSKLIFNKIGKFKIFIECLKEAIIFIIILFIMFPVQNFIFLKVHSILYWFILAIIMELLIVLLSYFVCLIFSPSIKNVVARIKNIIFRKKIKEA